VSWLWNVTEDLNVLHPGNWTELAEIVMANFTREVYLATKMKGWDGKQDDGESDLLWSFPGALLYSITVITTIGIYCSSFFQQYCSNMNVDGGFFVLRKIIGTRFMK